jgi:hypothetical protein
MAGSIPKEAHSASLNLWTLLPPGIDSDRVEAADKILQMGDVAVCKPTRSGFTTSAVVASERIGRKILFVAPTRNILGKTVRNTVEEMGGTPCDIPGNRVCKYIQEKIQKDPLLEKLPIMKEHSCDECEDYDECPVTEIERVEDFTTACITYSKLEAVMLSSSDNAQFIRDQLSDVDLVILDEAHLLSFPSLPQVDFGRLVRIPETYSALRQVRDRWIDLYDENRDYARQIEANTELDPQHYTGLPVHTHYTSDWMEMAKLWGELLNLAKYRDFYGVNDDDILALRDIITIMSGSTATISYLKSKDIGRMVVSGSQGRNQFALRKFLTEVAPKAQVIFVSGTLVERRAGFFSGLSGREIKTAIFPDLNNTTSKMVIHPSKRRFSTKDGQNGIDRVIEEARAISEAAGHEPIILFALNARLAGELEKALADLSNIKVDYYKSSDSIGVAQKARICIAVGAAEIPRHSCDPLASGRDDIDRYYDSQQLRINAVDSATWQAWSRVKDPDGLVESHVYCIGIRADEASRIATWGTNREVKVELKENGGTEASVHCEEYLGRPIMQMEKRRDLRPCRRELKDYVDAVVPISDVICARQKLYTFPYNNILGETVRFSDEPLRLYNRPESADEFERTYFALATLFVTRVDKCGLQWKQANYEGKFGYTTRAPPKQFDKLLEAHLFGEETIAQPPFDLEDNCCFCAVDFDDHDGHSPQSENVKKLTGFLKERNLLCIVVKSGSNDGYHVFIPIIPTKTLVANKFLKQLVKDAGMEDLKLERFPKQKSSGSTRGGYGTQIKIPLGFNWKAGKKSAVVDPCTLEPVEFVEVANAVKLRDIPEPSVGKKSKAPKRCTNQAVATYSSGEMRPCIRGVIDSGVQLVGGDGHTMRLAIAAEALRCGLSTDEAVRLFGCQDDFNEQYTRYKIEFLREKNYKKYSCEKLQDECGLFVREYCEMCPLSCGDFNDV